MTTSLTTFEGAFRERLLDVLYGQWHELGVPFADAAEPQSAEVIDPESLLWCSLEFVATEPRLLEGVSAWLRSFDSYLIRQRINRLAAKGEPRSNIWFALDVKRRLRPGDPTEPCHGLDSPQAVTELCQKLESRRQHVGPSEKPPGKPTASPSAILLRARGLLGNDIRHVLLVYLLANPSGGKLKNVQKWSGYSYRNIFETATRWQETGVLSIDHGYCRLVDPGSWRKLLRVGSDRVVIVDWLAVFDACVRLLRALEKAKRKSLTLDNPVVSSLRRDAQDALSSAALGGTTEDLPTLLGLQSQLRDETAAEV